MRGGPDDNVLTTQGDQMQDHTHIDEGHDHTDSGHEHEDAGHRHTDSGHTHQYYDKGLYSRGTQIHSFIFFCNPTRKMGQN